MESEVSLPHSQMPPLVPISSQFDQFHDPASYFLKIHSNVILPSPPGSLKWPLSLSSHHKILYIPLLSTICTTCPVHLILPHFITSTILGEDYWTLRSSLRSFLHSPLTSSRLGPNILLNTIFSNILSLVTSLTKNDQVSQPHKTAGKIIFLYIFVFKFLLENWKTKDSALNYSKHSLNTICSQFLHK